jgi:pimeloyl-ACP methyl ester carboxylesterase
MERPQTRYVAVGDADVAYQIIGQGNPDVLFCSGLGSHIDYFWDLEPLRDGWTRIASANRSITFDARGTGASDSVPQDVLPTWEEWAEDLGAVLDVVDSRNAVLIATIEAGPLALLFAALHPERVSGLVLINTAARFAVDDNYPIGYAPEALESLLEVIVAGWGTAEFASLANPGWAWDNELISALARQQRASATPRTAASQFGHLLRNMDVRPILGLIQAPTLVQHVHESPLLPIEFGRYLAEHIQGARLLEVQGVTSAYPSRLYSMGSSSSSLANDLRSKSTASSRRSCLPTSSLLRSAPFRREASIGVRCLNHITGWYAPSFIAFEDARS